MYFLAELEFHSSTSLFQNTVPVTGLCEYVLGSLNIFPSSRDLSLSQTPAIIQE